MVRNEIKSDFKANAPESLKDRKAKSDFLTDESAKVVQVFTDLAKQSSDKPVQFEDPDAQIRKKLEQKFGGQWLTVFSVQNGVAIASEPATEELEVSIPSNPRGFEVIAKQLQDTVAVRNTQLSKDQFQIATSIFERHLIPNNTYESTQEAGTDVVTQFNKLYRGFYYNKKISETPSPRNNKKI